METAIRLEHVTKHLGKKEVLKDLSFETYAGEVFGFLGPNGAGKTTTIKLLVGLLSMEEGKITVFGKDIEKEFEPAMAMVGGIVENPEMYSYMTGMQNLRQYARMRSGVTQERIDEVVRMVGLSKRIHEKVGKYSLGMRQRLGVAQCMLHRPRVLVLDEPTNGLDPAGIRQLRDILKHLAHQEGTCVFVSSHMMSEMELMCDRVGILVDGRLAGVKTLQEMVAERHGDELVYRYHAQNPEMMMNAARQLELMAERAGEEMVEVRIPADQEKEKLWELNRTLAENQIVFYSAAPVESRNLEDAFMELTGKEGKQIV